MIHRQVMGHGVPGQVVRQRVAVLWIVLGVEDDQQPEAYWQADKSVAGCFISILLSPACAQVFAPAMQ
jgi:hypothetical protein